MISFGKNKHLTSLEVASINFVLNTYICNIDNLDYKLSEKNVILKGGFPIYVDSNVIDKKSNLESFESLKNKYLNFTRSYIRSI